MANRILTHFMSPATDPSTMTERLRIILGKKPDGKPDAYTKQDAIQILLVGKDICELPPALLGKMLIQYSEQFSEDEKDPESDINWVYKSLRRKAKLKEKIEEQLRTYREDMRGKKEEVQEIHKKIAEMTKGVDYPDDIRCAICDNWSELRIEHTRASEKQDTSKEKNEANSGKKRTK